METKQALAMVFREVNRPFVPQHIDLPELEPGEVLVEIQYTTICSSDLHTYHGRRTGACPGILGHEIMGVVAATGGGVRAYDGAPLQPGDRITWTVYAHNHDGPMALRGLPQKSHDLFKYGHEPLQGPYLLSGGFATHCHLKAGTDLFKLPPQLTPAEAAPLNCTHATIAGALRLAGSVRDKQVLVIGAGMLGLSACAMCRAAGARRVWTIDIDEERSKRSLDFGAHAFFSAEADTEQLRARLQARGGLDLVIDTSGAPPAMEKGLALLSIGGTCIWVGAVYSQRDLSVNAEFVVRNLLTIKGLHNYIPADLAQAINFLADNHRRYPFAELVQPAFPLSSLSQAFAAAPTAYRVGVFPDGTGKAHGGHPPE